MRIEIFSDVVCPWCYLGTRRLELALAALAPTAPVEVVHRSFQLDPDAERGATVDTAALLAERYGRSLDEVAARQRDLERLAAADGLEYHLEGQRSGNTLDAHRLLHLARERGCQQALVERLFRAHFTEGRSVFDATSLEVLAVEVGLERAEAAEVLAGDRYAEAVAADVAAARGYGIRGVPFFLVDGRLGISGAQPADVLRAGVEKALAGA